MRMIPEISPGGKAAYQTRQRQVLLACMQRHEQALSAVEWAALLKREQPGEAPGQSTVYRLLKALSKEGKVRRLAKAGSLAQRYQLDGHGACRASLHLKCQLCGSLIHVPQQQTRALSEQLQKTAQFVVDPETTTVFGWCLDCKTQEEA